MEKTAKILIVARDPKVVDFNIGPEADTNAEAMLRAIYANDENLDGWLASNHSRENHPGMPAWMADALIIVR